MKRIIAGVLCVVLLLAALPGNAVSASGPETVKQEVRRIYEKCLALSGKESFNGFCGLMTSMQLWQLGVNETLTGTYNGNRQYDYYASIRRTSGGYRVATYSSEAYTLGQALNAITRNGTQDAEKILVGFESTNTEAGSVYGHACVIHKILDGKVYFVENFATSLAGEEGSVICLSINEFVSFYEGWAVLDGVVHFVNDGYANDYEYFGTDLYVRTRFDSTLRSEPCLLTEGNCVRLRSLKAGEMLHATAVYLNARDELYYYIDDGDRVGYVAASAVSVIRLNEQSLKAEGVTIPTTVAPGEAVTLSGKVSAQYCTISAVRVQVSDGEGAPVLEAEQAVDSHQYDLQQINEQLDFTQLAEGTYQIEIAATASCVAVTGKGLMTRRNDQTILRQSLTVGQGSADQPVETKEPEEVLDGWFLREGVWHCYEDGKPCTGWVKYLGIEYFLKEDGSVTTGWAEVEGWNRYFTATGALCVGWVTTDEGVRYWMSDGTEAQGWQHIDGRRYYFDDQFLMVTEGTMTDGDVTYRFQEDGKAVPVTEE